MPASPAELTVTLQWRTETHVQRGIITLTDRVAEVRWVLAGVIVPPRCIIQLPNGTELLVPDGQGLTRDWLLGGLRLYAPAEFERLRRHSHSPYDYVSNRDAHCVLAFEGDTWVISTHRDDVATEVGGRELVLGERVPLRRRDQFRLGGASGLLVDTLLL